MSKETKKITISEAAIILRVRYQKARDLVLSGQLGEVDRDERGRYRVDWSRVEQHRKESDK